MVERVWVRLKYRAIAHLQTGERHSLHGYLSNLFFTRCGGEFYTSDRVPAEKDAPHCKRCEKMLGSGEEE